MDYLLKNVTQQAMNYAIRTGISLTGGYAIKQCTQLVMAAAKGEERDEIKTLQARLESKIRIIAPAIDMIELIAARGNTSLESAVGLTNQLRLDIQKLGTRLERAVGEQELARKGGASARSREQNALELKLIASDMKKLLERIEDALPLINLAITTSGASMSTTLPQTVSPSRLLQASTWLTAGDSQYMSTPSRTQQIGPTFTLSMYMLFAGHSRRPQDEQSIRETTWKEVIHKMRMKLLRVPLDMLEGLNPSNGVARNGWFSDQIPSEGKAHEFAYQFQIIEDLDDDRVHSFEEGEPQPGPYDDVESAGIREIIPIHQISKIFYADTGKILNIGTEGETNNPILLIKRDVNAQPPRRMMRRQEEWDEDESPTDPYDEQSELDAQLRRESSVNLPEEPLEAPEQLHDPWRLPPGLDPEWMAFEVYTESPLDSDTESELEAETPSSAGYKASSRPATPTASSKGPSPLAAKFSNLNISTPTPSPAGTPQPPNTQLIPSPTKHAAPLPQFTPRPGPLPAIKTTLSLLEMLIRLTSLQQFQQSSHLVIPDEHLNFFLDENATVGAGGDADLRRRVRRDAMRRVGFDPYNESPIKRRGEEYQSHNQDSENHGEWLDGEGQRSPYGDDYDSYNNGVGEPHYGGFADAPDTFDYNGYPRPTPSVSSRSRSQTPSRIDTPSRGQFASNSRYSPSTAGYSPSSPGYSTQDIPLPSREQRPMPRHAMSSPSPLLRRATGNTGPIPFRGGPLTAPATSSSPRVGLRAQGKENVIGLGVETPPSSGKKE
ncbi:Ran-binding-domain-containing protein [Lophium mytilinum]|uniref:Ran-binding-domain-containing protein n=1 Tax=Lophium mytilinum TaxID=390894 RepID=A0A6A6QRZ3_9PEZI|nr:Ran-binding-domain-containing protein [Lophium mytilinum]